MITFVRDECDHIFGEAELAALAGDQMQPLPRRYLPPFEAHVLNRVFVCKKWKFSLGIGHTDLKFIQIIQI